MAQESILTGSSRAPCPGAASRDMRRGRRLARWLIPALLLASSVILQLCALINPSLTEHYYSRALYPHIARALGFFNRLLPLSLAEIILLGGAAGLLAALIRHARLIHLRCERVRALLASILLRLLWLAGLGLPLFLFIWGLNYERQPLAVNLGLVQREAEASELEAICRHVVARINENFQAADAPATNGATRLPFDRAQLVQRLDAAYAHETDTLHLNVQTYSAPKPIFFSHALTRLGISGFYMPFTGEANYDAEIPACDLPFAVAHEMAHARGFAREDEANFVAFLVCINSTDPYIRYSGYLNALGVFGPLVRLAPASYREIARGLATGPRADLKARDEFWARNLGKASRVSALVNDAYLKANRIKSGVKNYHDVVSLIIGYYLLHPDQTVAPVQLEQPATVSHN